MNDAAPGAPPLLSIDNVTKSFGAARALDGISFDVRQGEFFALLGPSGCGKTTLMRIIAGFETPTSGEVRIEGKSLAGSPPWARPVNMMFQSYALFPHLSVEKNVAFGLVEMGLPKDEIRARVAEMLRLVQLSPYAGRKPQQLSGGQRQRVALARALARAPKILLLDEPLGALDRKLREETRMELTALQARLGLTFIVVTHDQDEAMAMANRVAVMNAGRVEQVAPPHEIYERPRSRFVAGFVGDVELIEARHAGGGVYVTAQGESFVTAHEPAAGEAPSVTLAIRPEKAVLAREPGPNVFAGEVVDLSYLGHRTLLRVKLPSGLVLRASVNGVCGLSRDDAAQIAVSPADILVLQA